MVTIIIVVNIYSDPTYEAWKLTDNIDKVELDHDSDPTYEAWKLHIPSGTINCFRIPILPMRHGNKI